MFGAPNTARNTWKYEVSNKTPKKGHLSPTFTTIQYHLQHFITQLFIQYHLTAVSCDWKPPVGTSAEAPGTSNLWRSPSLRQVRRSETERAPWCLNQRTGEGFRIFTLYQNNKNSNIRIYIYSDMYIYTYVLWYIFTMIYNYIYCYIIYYFIFYIYYFIFTYIYILLYIDTIIYIRLYIYYYIYTIVYTYHTRLGLWLWFVVGDTLLYNYLGVSCHQMEQISVYIDMSKKIQTRCERIRWSFELKY